MSGDTLTLGPFSFVDYAPPEQMSFGGEQVVKAHKMPGGYRTVDIMGPDDAAPKWSGFFFSDDALDQALTLDAMRKAGQELAFSWGAESRTVVIVRFEAKVEKPTYVHYDIELMYTDDSTTPDAGAGLSLLASMVADLDAAIGLA